MANVATEARAAAPLLAAADDRCSGGEVLAPDAKVIWRPSAAAGAFQCFFSRRSLLAVLCATAFFAVVANFSNYDDLDDFATLQDEYTRLPEAPIIRDTLEVAKVETAVAAKVPELEPDVKNKHHIDVRHDTTEADAKEEEAEAYTVRGLLQDLRSVLSFAMGVITCSLMMNEKTPDRVAARELRRQERNERRQAHESSSEGAESDSEGEGSDSESEDEGDERMKRAKLYLYMM